MQPDELGYDGQKSYTDSTLASYDKLVLGISNRLVWRCPTERLVAQYEQHHGAHHVDIGPGSGYYLATAEMARMTRLTIMDANPTVLAHVSDRVAHLEPTPIEINLLDPIEAPADADSVALSYVLHCLPGSFEHEKRAAIAHAAALLKPGGVLFGSTILAEGQTLLGKVVMPLYNRLGIFGNNNDTESGLRAALEAVLGDVTITIQGAVAIFHGRREV